MLRELIYGAYARRLRSQVRSGRVPAHVGIIMDGNRRWARQIGMANPSVGHQYGAEHVEDALSWCEQVGVKYVTLFICSTENLLRRDDAEVAYLMDVVEQVVTRNLTQPHGRWQVHVAGMLDVLPDSTARALKAAVESTRDCATGSHATLAVGYGGRQEVIDAIRSLLLAHASGGGTIAELADVLTSEDISRYLYNVDQPDPDLIIRTSGEQRLSNFLLWQAAQSELYFCDAYWPAFREIDFLRALRGFGKRHRKTDS